MTWKIPERRTKDFYALSLGGTLLFEGDSSRLYQKLVKGDESEEDAGQKAKVVAESEAAAFGGLKDYTMKIV